MLEEVVISDRDKVVAFRKFFSTVFTQDKGELAGDLNVFESEQGSFLLWILEDVVQNGY